MNTDHSFPWTEFYMEFAERLLRHKDDRIELVAKVREVCNRFGYHYLDNSGTAEEGSGLPDICPFTTMGTFTRGVKPASRQTIAAELGQFLGVKSHPPVSFDGIPILSPTNSVVFWDRDDIVPLWQVFEDAIAFADKGNHSSRESLISSYNRASQSVGVGRKLSMGFFWIRPYKFVSLDNKSAKYLKEIMKVELPTSRLPEGDEYLELVDYLYARFLDDEAPVHSFQELSLVAYAPVGATTRRRPRSRTPTGNSESSVWLIRAGAQGQDEDLNLNLGVTSLGWQEVPDLADATDLDAIKAHVREAYPEKSNHAVGSTAGQLASFRLDIQEGDIVVLPLKTRPGFVAIGHITGPYEYQNIENDRRHIRSADWMRDEVPRSDFGDDLQSFLNSNGTVRRLRDDQGILRIQEMLDNGQASLIQPYAVSDIVSEGCFLEENTLAMILERFESKKNLILQGPPGTGKTWLAKKLAFALIGQKDDTRVSQFQFHPNLSYEDFIRGYRPDSDGRLNLVDGPFLRLIEEAKADTSKRYVMVIEEINRGNPAQILGEMLTLLEADKRSPGEGLRLAHARRDDERIHIPPNVYVIGTMNLADRSIALVDLALRRRFAFADLAPNFGNTWQDWVHGQFGVPTDILENIRGSITSLNERIENDHSLGPQFCIGHSYLTPSPGTDIRDPVQWFKQVVDTEIGPLLEEYWFDRTYEEAKRAREALLRRPVIARPDKPTVGTIGRVPIRNIWLLMLYASELYRDLPFGMRVNAEENPDELADLVAELLVHAVERRMHRNLTFGYRRRQADLDRVRGRIDLLRTERRQLLQRGRVACSFDELTVDTPRNRFVKAALDLIRRLVRRRELANRCRIASGSMARAGVIEVPVSSRHQWARTPLSRLGRLGMDDRQMLAAARLAFNLALPTEDPGNFYLSTPDRDEYWARRLFEHAVAGFYEVALPSEWRVSHGKRIHWPVTDQSPGIKSVLPSMQTDIELERSNSDEHTSGRNRIVIDTKFTSILAAGHHKEHTLSSGYIYQMYAYVKSQEREDVPSSLNSTGILLHPSVDGSFDEYAVIQGHKIRFATVDLASDTRTIRNQLIRILE